MIEVKGKRGNAVIYERIPELRHTNLRAYYNRMKGPTKETRPTQVADVSPPIIQSVRSRAVEKVLSIGKQYGIDNIDDNWVDALVILNFTETVATKFLMDHRYTEDQIKQNKMHWEEKIVKLESKLFEETKKQGIRPRVSVLAVLKSYREQRNNLDHEAHVVGARISKDEVDLLLKTLEVFVKQVLAEHKKYCTMLKPPISS